MVFDAVAARRSADDGIFHDHDLFPGQQRPDGVQLDAHAEITHGLRRLDEGPAHVMVADHAHLKGNAAFLGVPEGGVVAGIGKGHDQVHIGPVFPGQTVAQPFAAEIDVLAENLTVRPGEVDQFEDAMGRLHLGERHQAVQAGLVDDDDLPGLDIPDICGAHQIKGAGLGGDDPAAVELAQRQGPETARIADGDDLVAGQHDEAVGPLDPFEGLDQGLFNAVFQVRRHQVNDDFAVHGGLKNGPPVFQLRPQLAGVDEVAVMGQGVVFVAMVDQKRLGVGDDGRAGGGVTDMADRQAARQSGQGIFPEDFGYQPHALAFPDLAAVRRGDAGAFLPAVLKRKETEKGHARRLLMPVNGKDAAFLPGLVVISLEILFSHHFPICLFSQSSFGGNEKWFASGESNVFRLSRDDVNDPFCIMITFGRLLSGKDF